jgi:adenosine deaminase
MGTQAENDRQWLARLPKIELHLHLEGAIPLGNLWQLISKYGGDGASPSRTALAERFVYQDFPHFLRLWEWKNSFLREYDDFTLIAEAVARDLVRQGVLYAEVFYSPADFASHGLEPQRLTEAIRNGLDKVEGLRVALVADLVRDFGPELGMTTLEQVAEVRGLGVIGIGIGGAEHEVPPAVFSHVYERARELGFRTSAHAGEAAGADSVWSAIHDLQVDRIGHGTRAVEDPELIEYLASRSIPIELCPISNLRTGVIDSIAAHPVRRLYDRGIPISINTDDPAMFGTSLVDELHALMVHHDFDRAEIKRLMIDAIECTWLTEPEQQELQAAFAAEIDDQSRVKAEP